MTTAYPGSPIISPGFATTLSIFHTALYVGVLYLFPSTRPRKLCTPTDALRQDDPTYIKSRVRAVTFATIFSVVITQLLIMHFANYSFMDAQIAMGLWPRGRIGVATLWGCISEIVKVMALVAWLFMGSLWERFVVRGGWRQEELRRDWNWLRYSWVGWRILVVGPVTEEIVFRACMVPLHILAGRSYTSIIWTSPLFFGIAHVHHFYEFLLRNPTLIILGLLRTIAQFIYTTMFGWFATFVFIRTGCVWNAILTHMFCNYIGVPTFGRIHDQGDDMVWGKWVNWVHWAGHVVGLVGFCYWLWPLTEGSIPLLEYVESKG